MLTYTAHIDENKYKNLFEALNQSNFGDTTNQYSSLQIWKIKNAIEFSSFPIYLSTGFGEK